MLWTAWFNTGAATRGVEALRHDVLTIDKLTCAGCRDALAEVVASPRHHFLQADVADSRAMETAFRDFDPDAVLHLAAESHVDRSIDAPEAFVATNVRGIFVLLEAALRHWSLRGERREGFRFCPSLHRRSIRHARRRRAVQHKQQVRPELPVRRQQGCRRPFRQGVASHLRHSRHRHQLLEQLRTSGSTRKN
jgi:hypothetical protein